MNPTAVPFFNSQTPAAPSGYQNAKYQTDGGVPVQQITTNTPSTGGAVVKTSSYSASASDCGQLISFEGSSASTYTLLSTPPFAQWTVFVQNNSTANVTISPGTATLNGSSSSITLAAGTGAYISTDGTNYKAVLGGGGGGVTASQIQQESLIYAADTGSANAYAISQSPSPTLTAGSIAVFKVAHTNTGASALAVNGGSAITVKKESASGLADLVAGDWQAGQVVVVIYDGTYWQWVSGAGSSGVAPNQPYHLVMSITGQPLGGMTWQWECPADISGGVSFQSNFNGLAKGYVRGAVPTATATWTLYYVASGSSAGSTGTSIGSILISTSGAFTFTLTAQTFSPGDTMVAVYQSTADATLSGFGCVLPGYRAGTISMGGTGGFVQLGGDLGGTDIAPKVIAIQGVGVSSTAPTNGQVLEYNSGSGLYAPASVLSNPMTAAGDLIVGGSGGSPTRLGIGSNGQALSVVGGSLAWSGGSSPLYGIGGLGNNGLGTLKATYSNTGTASWGPFGSVQIDGTRTFACSAGHVYRIVFYFVGGSGGANLCLMYAGLTGASSGGYFVGNANIYYVSGSSYTGFTSNVFGTNVLNDAYAQIVEVYLWVRAATNNRLWANGFSALWVGTNDTHEDFTSHNLQIGVVPGGSPSALTAAYAYDLGTVLTS